MKSSFLIAVAAAGAGLVVACLLVFWPLFSPRDAAVGTSPAQGAPWQVDLAGQGRIQVMGLNLPGSTLADLHQRWGRDLKLALIIGSDGTLALEGYLESFEAGGVSGRLLLAFDTQAQAGSMHRWRDALPGTPMGSGGRQHVLTAAAITDLAPAALVGVSFIPLAQLDAQVLTARFGPPAERIAAGGRLEHWLYPTLGLAVVLDAEGREVLQYVAPADFESRLAAPVRAARSPQ